MIAKIPKISAVDLKARIDAGEDLFLLDVREPYEFTGYTGHIPASMLIPMAKLASLLPTLPKDKTIIVICHSGSRSLHAASLLHKHGFDALSLDHGMIEWNNEGFDVER